MFALLGLFMTIGVGVLLARLLRRGREPEFPALASVHAAAWPPENVLRAAIAVAVLYTLPTLLDWVGLLPRATAPSDINAAAFLAMAFGPPAAILTILACLRPRAGVPPPPPPPPPVRPSRLALQALTDCAALLPATLAAAFLSGAALGALGFEVEMQKELHLLAGLPLPSWTLLAFIVLAVAVAPLCEELLFRRVALPFLLRAFRPRTALALTSLIFALAHRHPAGAAPLFVVGWALGSAYLRSGRIASAILLHGAFNAVSIAMTLALSHAGLLDAAR